MAYTGKNERKSHRRPRPTATNFIHLTP